VDIAVMAACIFADHLASARQAVPIGGVTYAAILAGALEHVSERQKLLV
jgi:hypothetical protein